MEGLIPLVYNAIVQYRNGGQGPLASLLNESPSASYMRLPGDSGRFQGLEKQAFGSDSGKSTTQITLSTGVQSPMYRLTTTRRVAT